MEEGYTVEDFKRAIDNKSQQWLGTDKEMYLRPTTLFNSEKFEGYANEDPTQQEPKTKMQATWVTTAVTQYTPPGYTWPATLTAPITAKL